MHIGDIIEQLKVHKVKVIIAVILLIIVICFYVFRNKNSIDNKKTYRNQNIVFTSEKTSGDYVSSLPQINLTGNSVLKANEELITLYYDTVASSDKYMMYEYYKNDDILSLAVKIYNKFSDTPVPVKSYFYNVDIDRKMVLTDNELKLKYNVTDSEAGKIILQQVREYYDYELEHKYISNCSFACYYSSIEDLSAAKYYVKDNNLYAYLVFMIDRDFAYEENNPFDLFNFKIK